MKFISNQMKPFQTFTFSYVEYCAEFMSMRFNERKIV